MKQLKTILGSLFAAIHAYRKRSFVAAKKRFREGFSLVQMSVILAVAGVAVASLLPGEKAGSTNDKYISTINHLGGSVQRAFNAYRAKYGRLPCPADGTLSLDNTNAGREADNPGACIGGSVASNMASGNLAAGIIPYASLGLQERQVRDLWGRWVTYVVDVRATDPDLCLTLTTGDIEVENYGATEYAMMVFIIHGPSGHGAFYPARAGNITSRFNAQMTSDSDELLNASMDAVGADSFTGSFVKKDLIPGIFDSYVMIPYNSNVCCQGFAGCFKCNAKITGAATDYKISTVVNNSSNYAGTTIAKGDFNGDGVPDLVIGSPTESSNRGKVYVMFGSPSLGDPMSLNTINGSSGFSISGELAGDYFGASVAVGDINTDGRPDLVVGAPEAGSAQGTVYVFYGKSSYSAAYSASTLTDGTQGFDITGPTNERIGYSVAVGNVLGASAQDIIISGHGAATSNKGAVYAVWGGATWSATQTLASLVDGTGTLGIKVAGNASSDVYGWRVAARDIDGDNYDDVLFTNPGGRSYVLFGQATWTQDYDTSDMTGTVGKAFNNSSHPGTGQAITGLDFNGDGIGDFAIASDKNNVLDSDVVTYLIYGSVTAKSSWADTTDLTNTDTGSTPAGFKVLGNTNVQAVAGGDIDNDGNDELIVGQPSYDPGSAANTGRVVLIYGTPSMGDTFDLELNPTLIDGERAAAVEGKNTNDYFGASILVADIRQDNGADLAVAIPQSDDDATTNNGAVALIGRCKWRCGNMFGDGTYYGGDARGDCDISQCQGFLPCIISW